MSEAFRDFEEWLVLYAKKHHCTVAQAKATAMATAIKLMFKERESVK